MQRKFVLQAKLLEVVLDVCLARLPTKQVQHPQCGLASGCCCRLSFSFAATLWKIFATIVLPGGVFTITAFDTTDVQSAAPSWTALAVKGKAYFPSVWGVGDKVVVPVFSFRFT